MNFHWSQHMWPSLHHASFKKVRIRKLAAAVPYQVLRWKPAQSSHNRVVLPTLLPDALRQTNSTSKPLVHKYMCCWSQPTTSVAHQGGEQLGSAGWHYSRGMQCMT